MLQFPSWGVTLAVDAPVVVVRYLASVHVFAKAAYAFDSIIR